MDVNMICRLCLNYIQEGNMISLFNAQYQFCKLVENITKYIQLEITQDDEVSTVICLKCYKTIEDFDAYCTYIEKQQRRLQSDFQKDIKFEPEHYCNKNPYTDAITQFEEYSAEPQTILPDAVVKCEPDDHSEFIVTEFETSSWNEVTSDTVEESLSSTRMNYKTVAASQYYMEDHTLLKKGAAVAKPTDEPLQLVDSKLLAKRAAGTRRIREYKVRHQKALVSIAPKQQSIGSLQASTSSIINEILLDKDHRLMKKRAAGRKRSQKYRAREKERKQQCIGSEKSNEEPLLLEDEKLLVKGSETKRAQAAKRAQKYRARQKERKRQLMGSEKPNDEPLPLVNEKMLAKYQDKLLAKREASAKRSQKYRARERERMRQCVGNEYPNDEPLPLDEKLLVKWAAAAKRDREYQERQSASQNAATACMELSVQSSTDSQTLDEKLLARRAANARRVREHRKRALKLHSTASTKGRMSPSRRRAKKTVAACMEPSMQSTVRLTPPLVDDKLLAKSAGVQNAAENTVKEH